MQFGKSHTRKLNVNRQKNSMMRKGRKDKHYIAVKKGIELSTRHETLDETLNDERELAGGDSGTKIASTSSKVNGSVRATTSDIDNEQASDPQPKEFEHRKAKFNRKSLALAVELAIVVAVVLAYFGYKLHEYFDTKKNRNEYTRVEEVDEMGVPYVYLDAFASCHLEIIFDFEVNGMNYTYIVFYVNGSAYAHSYDLSSWSDSDNYEILTMRSSKWSSSDICPFASCTIFGMYYFSKDNVTIIDDVIWDAYTGENLTIDTIYELTKDDFMIVYRKHYSSTQFLLIPPSNARIPVGKKSLKAIFTCDNESDSYAYAGTWYQIDHKDEIKSYDNAQTMLDKLWLNSNPVDANYKLSMSYIWYSHDNTVDIEKDIPPDERNDYYSTSIEGSYASEFQVELEIAPSPSGLKMTYVIERLFAIYDVISSTGGMFATVNSFCTMVFIYLIWGFDFGFLKYKGKFFYVHVFNDIFVSHPKHRILFFFCVCLKCCVVIIISGWAHDASPPQKETRKLEGFVNRTVSQNYVSKEDLEEQMRIIKQRIGQLENANQQQHNINDDAGK